MLVAVMVVHSSAARLVALAAEWETYRRPLLDSIRTKKDSYSKRKVTSRRACIAARASR